MNWGTNRLHIWMNACIIMFNYILFYLVFCKWLIIAFLSVMIHACTSRLYWQLLKFLNILIFDCETAKQSSEETFQM